MQEGVPKEVHCFTYKRTNSHSAAFYLFVGLLPSLSILLILATIQIFEMHDQGRWGDPGRAIPVCIELALYFVPLGVLAYLAQENQMSDIVIDPSGISRYSRGKLRKTIAWPEVSRIRVTPIIMRKPATLTYVVETMNNPYPKRIPGYGGIQVTNAIQRLQELLDLLNLYVAHHDIPIIDSRGGSAI
ncbi:MAG: hypothetical protein WA634_12995, partial [Silvibacterium sp.]